MSVAVVPDRLQAELKARGSRLRPPEVVMRPEMLGAARLTRYSFSRTMLRRAVAGGWTACRARQDLDAEARGESVYTVEADGHRFSFVAFTPRPLMSQPTPTGSLLSGGKWPGSS